MTIVDSEFSGLQSTAYASPEKIVADVNRHQIIVVVPRWWLTCPALQRLLIDCRVCRPFLARAVILTNLNKPVQLMPLTPSLCTITADLHVRPSHKLSQPLLSGARTPFASGGSQSSW